MITKLICLDYNAASQCVLINSVFTIRKTWGKNKEVIPNWIWLCFIPWTYCRTDDPYRIQIKVRELRTKSVQSGQNMCGGQFQIYKSVTSNSFIRNCNSYVKILGNILQPKLDYLEDVIVVFIKWRNCHKARALWIFSDNYFPCIWFPWSPNFRLPIWM